MYYCSEATNCLKIAKAVHLSSSYFLHLFKVGAEGLPCELSTVRTSHYFETKLTGICDDFFKGPLLFFWVFSGDFKLA